MPGKVAIGKQDFASVIENKLFYVDKTSFIKEWWERGDDVTLITRPRRFGKTLAMSMTERFLSSRYPDSVLFRGLRLRLVLRRRRCSVPWRNTGLRIKNSR